MSVHPPPEVPARLITDDDLVPRNARALATLAAAHGWTVTITYARGTSLRKHARVVDSIAVRLFRLGEPRVAAVWVEGKFDNAVTSTLMPLSWPELRARVCSG